MTSVDEIVQRLQGLESRLSTVERERDEYRALYLDTMERCRKLELGILSQKSERLPDNEAQLSLGVLSLVLKPSELEILPESIQIHVRADHLGQISSSHLSEDSA